jgi:hypothetical protein
MKTYGGGDVSIHEFLTSALARGEWSASSPGRFTPRERDPGTRWIGDWLGSVWTRWRGEMSWSYRDSNSEPSAVQPVVSRYNDCVMSPLNYTALQHRETYSSRSPRWEFKIHHFLFSYSCARLTARFCCRQRIKIGRTNMNCDFRRMSNWSRYILKLGPVVRQQKERKTLQQPGFGQDHNLETSLYDIGLPTTLQWCQLHVAQWIFCAMAQCNLKQSKCNTMHAVYLSQNRRINPGGKSGCCKSQYKATLWIQGSINTKCTVAS